MGHVPEVHDPADPQAVVVQHVVQAHVGVDHLCPQPGQRRGDPGLEPVQDPFHLGPARAVGKVGEQRAESGQVGEVPEDLVVGRGMEKAPQRPSQPGRDLPVRPDRPGGERGVGGHPAGQEGEQPRRVGAAVGPGNLDPGFARRARQGTHHRQARIHLPDVVESGVLHLHDGPVIGRVRDLEQEAPAVRRVHPEVLVPFAREGGEGGFHPEPVPEDLPGRLLAEGRRCARQRVKTLHHRPEGYPAAHGPATAAAAGLGGGARSCAGC